MKFIKGFLKRNSYTLYAMSILVSYQLYAFLTLFLSIRCTHTTSVDVYGIISTANKFVYYWFVSDVHRSYWCLKSEYSSVEYSKVKMLSAWHQWCRLCGTTDSEDSINVESLGSLNFIIQKHFSIRVSILCRYHVSESQNQL